MSREPDGGEAPTAPESARQGAPSAAADSTRRWLGIYLTGVCMGAADMVPGVSGGTIALVTGIYERLVTAIAALDPRVIAEFPAVRTAAGRRRLRETFVGMDVPFLLVLGAGIGTAVLVLSRLLEAAFEEHLVVLSAFFFALMAASAAIIYRDVTLETPVQYAAGAIGIVIAFALSGVAESSGGGSLPFVALSGMIAISAMVLPGISGAAFLYVLGQYEYLVGALNDFIDALAGLLVGGDVAAAVGPGTVVVAFMAGAVVGLLTMARVVKWALSRYRIATLAFLVGLMVGALRLPVEEAAAETTRVTPGLVAAIVAAGAIGAGAIVVLDRYTGSLDYA